MAGYDWIEISICRVRVIRSRRKTMVLQVKGSGEVLVRAPLGLSFKRIEEFVISHEAWIADTRQKQMEASGKTPVITEEERKAGIQAAKAVIPGRVEYYASRMGVTYGKITIKEQKTRWGSCSSKGNLNFNWKLVRLPQELLDYVVVHELAHRKEMNHSPAFWAVVEAELPDYRERRLRLKKQEVV